MKFFRYIACTVLCLAALCACKKEEEEEELKPSLVGSLEVPFPSYVGVGDVIDVVYTGVTHPEGKGLGYVFRDPLKTTLDTVRFENDPPEVTGNFQYTVPDSLGTFDFTIGVYADGYYNRFIYGSFTVINPTLQGGALSGHGIAPDDAKIQAADGQEYYYSRIGSLNWFRQNLRKKDTGTSYMNNCKVLDGLFGRYYTWEEARTACPEGWRLPTENDWANLAQALGCTDAAPLMDFTGIAGSLMADASFIDSKMWVYWRAVPISDAVHFCALPLGYGLYSGNTCNFKDFETRAVFWTADEVDDNAIYRSIYQNRNTVLVGGADKETFAASVRCVQDAH